MTHNFPELLHQASRVKDYRDNIRGSLFKMHNILTEYFPELDIKSLREMMRIIDSDFKDEVVETLENINHNIYK